MLSVPKKKYWKSSYSGMDCLEQCLNKEHFLNYSKKITYEYNSRGFRDKEWPVDLLDVIWCVGDSFTAGIGQPFEETWPQLLEKKIGKRCINLGEDGCSNDTISLRVKKIYDLYKPKLIIVMWSYLNRRRIDGKNIQFDKNDFGWAEDLANFKKNLNAVNKLNSKIINFLIPDSMLLSDTSVRITKRIMSRTLNLEQNGLEKINVIPQLDYARDWHHFGIKTCTYIADKIKKLALSY